MSVQRLYTPEVLAAAVSLAKYPLTPDLAKRGSARSASCGSRIELGLGLDADDRIERVGLASHACAIGQASAAVFADAAKGMRKLDIITARDQIALWLSGEGEMPEWPGLDLISAAKDYPGRHGAMLLAWNAACDALAD